MPKYLRKFVDDLKAPVEGGWFHVNAPTHRDAVFKGFDPAKSGVGMVHCLVAEDRRINKRSNGLPICLHAFSVQVGDEQGKAVA